MMNRYHDKRVQVRVNEQYERKYRKLLYSIDSPVGHISVMKYINGVEKEV